MKFIELALTKEEASVVLEALKKQQENHNEVSSWSPGYWKLHARQKVIELLSSKLKH